MIDTEEQVQESVSKKAADAEERLVIGSAALADDGAPARVLIAPWGKVESANGTFVVDEESAQLVIEAFENHGTDLPIDYEHQSLGGSYASPNGQAPAAGWIRSLRAVSPDEAGDEQAGLIADVEWTEGAQEKLAAKEYRYLSPVMIVRKQDRRVVALHSAALTNKPAIVGMKPIVNRQEGNITTDGEELDEVVEVLRMRLGLGVEDEVTAVLLAAEERLSSLTRQASEREARERVMTAMQAGKLTTGQRDWAMAMALKDPKGFEEWVESAPVVVMLGRTEAPANVVGTKSGRGRSAVIASARATFNSEPGLGLLTNESAWIRDALREAGLEYETCPHP